MKTAVYADATLLKDVKLDYFQALSYIQKSNVYFLSILPVIPYNKNPSAIRTAISKRLLQIVTWCEARQIKVCVLLPDRDIDFYAGLFNMSGVKTISMLKQDPLPGQVLTDHYFLAQTPKELIPVYNVSSCVFVIQDEDTDDETSNSIENENIVIFNIPAQGEVKFVDEGSPLDLINSYKRETHTKTATDPYSVFPDLNDNLVKRVPLHYFEDMMAAKPQHDEPRVQITSRTKGE